MGSITACVLRRGAAIASIIGSVALYGGASAAEADPQVAEFLASVNRSITELSGRPGPQASTICGRFVASAINMDAVITQRSIS